MDFIIMLAVVFFLTTIVGVAGMTMLKNEVVIWKDKYLNTARKLKEYEHGRIQIDIKEVKTSKQK